VHLTIKHLKASKAEQLKATVVGSHNI